MRLRHKRIAAISTQRKVEVRTQVMCRPAHPARTRAIRRCGELMKQIEPARGKHWETKRDGTVPSTRQSAATEAGLSERQRKTARLDP